jgi:hypothetical protein
VRLSLEDLRLSSCARAGAVAFWGWLVGHIRLKSAIRHVEWRSAQEEAQEAPDAPGWRCFDVVG